MATKVTLNLPKVLWTAKDMAGLAANTLASIKLKTSKGPAPDGKSFQGYSPNPLYFAKRRAPLQPNGV